jgi:acetylornithine deacetylase/succinyl-diaminopimelate desuccinylase-like protein
VDASLKSLLDDPGVCRAAAYVRKTDEDTLADQLGLTAVAAPPFGEAPRAAAMGERLRCAGLRGVCIDEIGNVVALRPGAEDLPAVIVSAHLDTVFPADVPVEVNRIGDLLLGPGISDDGRGLAVLLAVARALEAGGISTRHPVLFAATVGEEGLGDLRGAKHLVSPSGAGRGAAAFVSVDGAGLDRIVTRGLGSRRFRVRVSGPGGHSWQDRGTVNPIHALGRAVEALADLVPAGDASSALTVARWGGGTSINAIPQDAWIEIDCRGASEERLEALEAEVRRVVAAAVAVENAAGRDTLRVSLESVGMRTGGATDPRSAVVRAARRASEAVGAEPLFTMASTDANAAMAAGIPALTMGGGGEAGLAHTTEEWYRNVRGVEGVLRALYTVVLTAELAR